MFLVWRTQLREAQQACDLGRLEEAAQRLTTHQLRKYQGGEAVAQQLARAFIARARRRAEEQNFGGATHDLEQARELAGQTEAWLQTERFVTQQALLVIEPPLATHDFAGALRLLSNLPPHCLPEDIVRDSQAAVRHVEAAWKLEQRQLLAEAAAQLSAAARLRPEWQSLAERIAQLRAQVTTARPPGQENSPSAPQAAVGSRFLLWVDAVGGYLVCLSDEIWLGQATPGNVVAVPILAELSRQHAKLTRSGEQYILEAPHPVLIDGKKVESKRLLRDGDELELGRGVRLRFRQPHACSATAKLEFLSRHRTQPGCDGVVLMAESCVLGPQWQNHVVCRDWRHDVVLFRQGEQLLCRSTEPYEMDGVPITGRGQLQPNSRVVGADFSFSLESLKR